MSLILVMNTSRLSVLVVTGSIQSSDTWSNQTNETKKNTFFKFSNEKEKKKQA